MSTQGTNPDPWVLVDGKAGVIALESDDGQGESPAMPVTPDGTQSNSHDDSPAPATEQPDTQQDGALVPTTADATRETDVGSLTVLISRNESDDDPAAAAVSAPAPAPEQTPPPPAPKTVAFQEKGEMVIATTSELPPGSSLASRLHVVQPAAGGPQMAVLTLSAADSSDSATAAVARRAVQLSDLKALLESTDGSHLMPLVEVAVDADTSVEAESVSVLHPHYSSDVADHIHQRSNAGVGTVSEETVISVALQLLKALRCLRKAKLVHGNISTSTVMLEERSSGCVVTLSRFAPLSLTPPHTGDGEAAFAAPRALASGEPALSADIFSCGAVLLALVTGNPQPQIQGAACNDPRWKAGGLCGALQETRDSCSYQMSTGSDAPHVRYSIQLIAIIAKMLGHTVRYDIEDFLKDFNDLYGDLLTGVIVPEEL